jgi:NAD-dependent dihydropyrimidine dehydrogenase PreA subunit
VTYDAGKCIGCRYCMMACPFEIPAYEYHDPVAPRVRKCEFCAARLARAGGRPACVEACPMETLTFGPRARLLEEAHTRIGEGRSGQGGQGLYVDHVYGEHEVGGTSWLYLSPVPFASLGFAELPRQAPPRLTEAIQHGTFKLGLGPLGLLSVLGLAMYLLRSRKGGGEETREGGR